MDKLYEKLRDIIDKEIQCIKNLISSLEKQHKYVAENEINNMESVVKKIETANTEMAKCEIERRDLLKGQSMKDIIYKSEDENLQEKFRIMKNLVKELKLQKELNEMLIRQGLGYASRMLKILNPDRSSKTYSSYGKMR